MKKIEAIIREEHLNLVKTALEAAGFMGLTIYAAKGRGSSGGITLEWRAGSYTVDFLHKIVVMLVVPSDACDTVIQCIQHACSQDGGGGLILVSPVEKMIRF